MTTIVGCLCWLRLDRATTPGMIMLVMLPAAAATLVPNTAWLTRMRNGSRRVGWGVGVGLGPPRTCVSLSAASHLAVCLGGLGLIGVDQGVDRLDAQVLQCGRWVGRGTDAWLTSPVCIQLSYPCVSWKCDDGVACVRVCSLLLSSSLLRGHADSTSKKHETRDARESESDNIARRPLASSVSKSFKRNKC